MTQKLGNRIDGAMETGWQIVDGKKCYFDTKKGYEVFNQWVDDNGEKDIYLYKQKQKQNGNKKTSE